MIGEWHILEGLEGRGRDLIQELSRYLREGTEENMKDLSQDSRYPDLDSNRAPPEHKSGLLPLHKYARLFAEWRHLLQRKLFACKYMPGCLAQGSCPQACFASQIGRSVGLVIYLKSVP
jgi:hypothetical protein